MSTSNYERSVRFDYDGVEIEASFEIDFNYRGGEPELYMLPESLEIRIDGQGAPLPLKFVDADLRRAVQLEIDAELSRIEDYEMYQFIDDYEDGLADYYYEVALDLKADGVE